MKIFVVGDVGYDNYLVGKVRGLSAEAPIPIVDIQPPTLLPGMGGNVVANLGALGVEAQAIEAEDPNRPIKFRLMADGQQVARFDMQDWCKPIQRVDLLPLIDADAIIVSDYGKGAISDAITPILAGVSAPLFVDTKGDPSPWLASGAIMFPNQGEYDKYRDKYEWFPQVVLKQGSEGMSFVEYGKVTATRLPWARQVRCVNGAGDTVIASFAVAYLTLQSSIQHCLDVASAAAALVVEQDFLHRTTTIDEIGKRIANEVPEKVYNQVQTRNSTVGPMVGQFITGFSLPCKGLEQETPGTGAALDGAPSVGGTSDAVLAAAIRAIQDAWEEEAWRD